MMVQLLILLRLILLLLRLVVTYEITLDLNCSANWVMVATYAAAQATKFSITDAKLYVPVITLSPQVNAKLLEKLKSVFESIRLE